VTTPDLQEITSRVAEISRQVGGWMKEQRIQAGQAELKSPNNLVTFVDKESERRIVEALHEILPGAGFIAEEGTGIRNEKGFNWVIDPLDGTTNFVHGVPVWCISIALVDGLEPVAGVIYDPSSGECFEAFTGGGATLNGKRIYVSETAQLEKSLLATGFPYDDFGRENQYFQLLKSIMHKTRGIRRLGSAAIDMAWVACGRFEAFYEYGLNPWDVAAGTIIIREAGGVVSGFKPGNDPVFGEDIIAANRGIHVELIGEVGKFFV
jgi:myo-inositol-1(or 4)-monophosphatase